MRLLIIGTLDGQIGAASAIAMKRGSKVMQADDIDSGIAVLRSGKGADLIMIDVSDDIPRLIEQLHSERIVIPVVACGVANDTQAAVKAIRAGAKEYVPLPPDAELIAAVLDAASEETETIVHQDPKMVALLQMAAKVAPSEANILVTGPSGTGKELMARFIHNHSSRTRGPFIAVNCAAIPENLLESELFGYEKGAFTGAISRRLGKFEEAGGGTLLLDEISEMDIRLQAKLLRAIQEREIDRLGGRKPVKIDVRIVATSNRQLEKEVKTGTFREDLYFRLNVITLDMPSLQQRPEDIPLLVRFFAKKYAAANGLTECPVTSGAMKMLTAYPWPGNVRELENTMHRAVLMNSADEIDAPVIILSNPSEQSNDSEEGAFASTQAMVGRTVADVERELIIDTLEHCIGNRTHAATILGISIRTLRNKLKLYSDGGYAVPASGLVDRPQHG